MKKLTVILLSALLLLTVSGCSKADGTADVTSKDEAVLTVGNTNYTKGTFYKAMTASGYESMVLQKLTEMIYASQISEDDSEVIRNAEDEANELVEMAGDYLDFYLYYYAGVSSIEEYKELMIYYSKLDAIADKYIDGHLDSLVEEAAPKYVRVIEFADEETAKEALQKIKDGASFEDVAVELGTYSYSGEEIVILKQSAIDTNLAEAVSNAENTGLLDVVSGEEETWYVAEITDTDYNNFKDAFYDALINEGVVAEDAVLGYFAKEGNFRIYDEDLYNSFKEAYPDFFN